MCKGKSKTMVKKIIKGSLRLDSIPVELEDGQTVVHYELRALNGLGRDTYMSELSEQLLLGPDGRPTGLRSTKGLQLRLLALSMFDTNGQAVPQSTIEQWPAPLVEELFAAAQELSRLVDVPGAKDLERTHITDALSKLPIEKLREIASAHGIPAWERPKGNA